ncbi:MAG: arsinothricin resistance N-acetyltransferase ArsN1 family A [Thermomicrobiales bacterium]
MTPAAIHSSHRPRMVVTEQEASTIRPYAHPKIRICTRRSTWCAHRDAGERERGQQSLMWTQATVTDDRKAYLRSLLPEIRFAANGARVRLVPGSLRRRNEDLFADRDPTSLARIAAAADADGLVFGHTHKPWTRGIASVRFVNPGSVGKPKDGEPRAGWLLLTIDDAGSVATTMRRVRYDIAGMATGDPRGGRLAVRVRAGHRDRWGSVRSEIITRLAQESDAAAIAAIYNAGIRERIATFETAERSADDRAAWLRGHDPRYPVLVAVQDGVVVGWAGADAYRSQVCYAGVAEFSIYIAPGHRGKGIGRTLFTALIEASRDAGLWKLLSRIFVENTASRALCHRCGFREVGVCERHNQLDGVWRDVVIVERLIPENQEEG